MGHLRHIPFSFLFSLLLFCGASASFAEVDGGKGGAFLQIHTSSLGAFDPELSGNPVVIGGEGYAYAGKNWKIGGAGGAAFLWNPSDNAQFALGYGGLLGEYLIFKWLNARLLIGGGGYNIAKTVSQTLTSQVDEKLGSGGFLVVYPSIGSEFAITGNLKLGVRLGYFLPNVSRMQSFTLGIHILFGKG